MQSRRRGLFESEQTNLFHPKRVRPAWETIPVETRRQVTTLVARMLSAYRARRADPADTTDAEGQHD